jgi:hypothetical protein
MMKSVADEEGQTLPTEPRGPKSLVGNEVGAGFKPSDELDVNR